MRLSLLTVVFVMVACGGSSRDLDGSRGNGTKNGGDGGTDSVGGGGTAGTAGTGMAGTAGVAAGANGGAGARGGSTSAGDAGEPSGGVGAAGAQGGVAGAEPTGGTGGTAGAGATPSITSCTDAFRFLGTWEGNVLDFYFEPLQTMRLVVTPDDLGGYQGTLTIGSGDPPPPVAGPDDPYPNLEYWDTGGAGRGSGTDPWPGFPHTVVRGAGCDATLRVSISSAEPWDEWCSLQEPVYTDGYGWGCTYLGGGSIGGGVCNVQDGRGNTLGEYPAWKCYACAGFGAEAVCACDEASCSFNRTPTDTYNLQLIDDTVLSGTDATCGDCTVRLERVE
jgi:hypothetical protein